MNIYEATSSELLKLDVKDLQSLVRKVVNRANARIRLISKSDLTSPALNNLKEKRGENPYFSIKLDRNISQQKNKLVQELFSAKRFLNDETSTIRGTKRVLKQQADFFGFENKEELSKISKIYEIVKNNSNANAIVGYRNVVNKIRHVLDRKSSMNLSERALANKVIKELQQGYVRGL